MNRIWLIPSVALFLMIFSGCSQKDKPGQRTLLNVSYDPTREFYQEFNSAFITMWKERTGEDVQIRQSHGGSGKQARSVIDGLEADVVTLALAFDVNAISRSGLINPDWQSRLPHNSSPYYSTIVFLVRKGNPKQIHDWDDLVRDDVSVITPNPKTSGGARWNYLAAWGFARHRLGYGEEDVKRFVSRFYKNVPVLDTGARGATTTFIERGIGDVLIAWENEALLVVNRLARGNYELIVPSVSILAEPPVTVVDKVAERHGTTDLASGYVAFLYSEQGQRIAAAHFYRPRNEQVSEQFRNLFPDINLFTIDEEFGGWDKAQADHFSDNSIFDQLYAEDR